MTLLLFDFWLLWPLVMELSLFLWLHLFPQTVPLFTMLDMGIQHQTSTTTLWTTSLFLIWNEASASPFTTEVYLLAFVRLVLKERARALVTVVVLCSPQLTSLTQLMLKSLESWALERLVDIQFLSCTLTFQTLVKRGLLSRLHRHHTALTIAEATSKNAVIAEDLAEKQDKRVLQNAQSLFERLDLFLLKINPLFDFYLIKK